MEVACEGGLGGSGPVESEVMSKKFMANDDAEDKKDTTSSERPAKRPCLQQEHGLHMQVIDVDSYNQDGQCIIRLYGRTDHGKGVVLHVQGFEPYFYVDATPKLDAEMAKEMVLATLRNIEEHQVRFERVQRQNIMCYRPEPSSFFRIQSGSTYILHQCMQSIERDKTLEPHRQTYESNIPPTLRYMVDQSIQGASWISAPDLQPRSEIGHYNVTDIIAHPPEDEWAHLADFVVLSFDIECLAVSGHFPIATQDPVIQISSIVQVQGKTKVSAIFTLGTCAPIVDTLVCSYETEAQLFAGWHSFLHEWDPDILVGYNILGFDLPYLLDRASHCQFPGFAQLGRLPGHESSVRDKMFHSAQTGARESKEIDIPGRFILDMLKVIMHEHKLRYYSLNSVSAHFLGDQKEDIHYSKIPELQQGDAESRRKLATYCIKDAWLPLRLMQHLMILPNYVEMSRVTGVPLSYLMTRGQQVKVLSQLYRATRKEDMVIPKVEYKEDGNEVDYEGATVISPHRGFYQVPIATLDFASLYPSIMIAHNLCYTTFLTNPHPPGLAEEQITRAPGLAHAFVKPSVRLGILPRILKDLLAARKKAKADLKKETVPDKKAVLDGRQLALKISANSVYGFTGASLGKLPLKPIAETVTAFGRTMIAQTKEYVETHYPGAKVVYGDTDSVMVRFKEDLSVAEAMRLGLEAAELISKSLFLPPIKLEFEKVYFPFLLMNKKRYAGMYWTSPEAPLKLDAKGLETVRRDNCKLVASVMQQVLDTIFKEKDDPVQKAVTLVQTVVRDLNLGRIDMSQLIISKQLRKDSYKSAQPHVTLVEKMAKRQDANLPKSGDRVEYVIIQGAKGQSMSDRAENPLYALTHHLPIDVDYYLEHQLKEPLSRVFTPILGNKIHSTLFEGEHVRLRSTSVGSNKQGILAYTKKAKTCAGCKSSTVRLQHGLCSTCEPNRMQILLEVNEEKNQADALVHRLWTQCRKCQGTMHTDKPMSETDLQCAATSCPIFYKRTKARMDANKLLETHEDLFASPEW